MPKILIIGKNGFLGSVLAKDAEADFDVAALSQGDVDITDMSSVERALIAEKPDIVINTAAMSKVEACEQDPGQAIKLNALGSYNIAKVSADIGAKLVYISTDYVFDGQKTEYNEEDIINPLNAYGVSKAAGEYFVKAYNPQNYLIRSAVFFGSSPSGKTGFVDLMLGLADEGKEITVVDDLFMSPANIIDLSGAILQLLKKQADYGLYHITNAGSCSWFELAKKTFELAGVKANLKSVKAEEQKVSANRPHNSVLVSNRLKAAGIPELRSWQEALEEYLRNKLQK